MSQLKRYIQAETAKEIHILRLKTIGIWDEVKDWSYGDQDLAYEMTLAGIPLNPPAMQMVREFGIQAIAKAQSLTKIAFVELSEIYAKIPKEGGNNHNRKSSREI